MSQQGTFGYQDPMQVQYNLSLQSQLQQQNFAQQLQNSQTQAQKYGYDQQLAGAKYTSDADTTRTLGAANIAAQLGRYTADANKTASMYNASQAAGASKYSSDKNYDSTKYSSDASKAASEYGAAAAQQAANYGADKSLQGVKYGTDATNARFDKSLGWAQDRFGQIFGLIKGRQGGLGGSSDVQLPTGSGGINPGPVFTPDQIQQNVNNAVGRIDQRTEGANALILQSAGGRGMGSAQSPLVQALVSANTASGLGAGADAELNFRTQAGQANAGNILQGQTAAANAANSNAGLAVQQQKNQLDYNAALMQALAGLGGIGSIG